MVIKDGAKMSKSKGNVVDPDQLIKQYGADTVRLFSLFAAPPERDLEWNAQGVEGANRFLNRVYRYIVSFTGTERTEYTSNNQLVNVNRDLHRKIHQTIKRVTHDIETNFHFNTAISAVMELFNTLLSVSDNSDTDQTDTPIIIINEAIKTILILLSPMVPHFCSEMWTIMEFDSLVDKQSWPDYDEAIAQEDLLTIVVQVNGKVRSRLQATADISDDTLTRQALEDSNIQRFIEGKAIKKTIVVKKKLVNIVV
jgi:leucyl-tRNA synthetase